MLTSRERVLKALNHEEGDKVPLDLGGHVCASMHVSSVYKLRQALGLRAPDAPVKLVEPYQMLGEIELDLLDAIGGDVVGVGSPKTFFGYRTEDWKPWTFHDGTPVLVPGGFNTDPEPSGDILQYPDGDKSVEPSGKLPVGGYYFDTIVRQPPVDDERLNLADNLEEFGPISQAELDYFEREVTRLYEGTDKAIMANFGGTGFGDIALVPAPWLKHPKGIRDIEEWYVSTVSRRDYVYQIFEHQCEIALENLAKIHAVVGDRVVGIFTTGTDFGSQNGPFVSPRSYRNLFKPFHKAVNDWVHQNTGWKSMIHSCGSIYRLLPDMIEAGFDILNPVQIGAAEMDPQRLKDEFGDELVFWGGGIDTQKTLPFGSPDDVRREACRLIRIFGKGGGYVFNPIHNVQARVPVENLVALYEAANECRDYPLG